MASFPAGDRLVDAWALVRGWRGVGQGLARWLG
uniref:Uncharacterized protein n=1 Tax=Myoviridae sp. ctAca11 TaxID=2825043 RepID=A0A8S5Q7J6_9CAUD|nr:MAG TPA: hypothetical protein [Myoviridae sp. ctAca11]